MLPAILIEILLKLCYGLNIGTSAYHIKKKIPFFKIFSSFELWKNNPVSTRRYRFGNASSLLESVLVFELCIHRRHHRVNLRHVCSSFLSRPVQTSHHPLNRQQDNVHPLRVSRLPPITKLPKQATYALFIRHLVLAWLSHRTVWVIFAVMVLFMHISHF